jgi:hypothetical protein
MTFARLTLFAIGAAIIPHTLIAQRRTASRPIELGIDAALIHESSDNASSTRITLPVDRFRVGFFSAMPSRSSRHWRFSMRE